MVGGALDLYGTPIEVRTTFATMRAQRLENAISGLEGARGDTPPTTINRTGVGGDFWFPASHYTIRPTGFGEKNGRFEP